MKTRIKKRRAPKIHQTNVRLPPDLYEDLQRRITEERTPSEIMRDALRAWFAANPISQRAPSSVK